MSEIITLDEHFTIKVDSYNYQLQYEKGGELNTKTGKPIMTTDTWYFSKLSDCLQKYLNESLKVSNSVQELYDHLKLVEEKITKL